jgi:hypothetical protein
VPATKFSRYESSNSSSDSDEEDSGSELNDVESSSLQKPADTSSVGIPSELTTIIFTHDNNGDSMLQRDELTACGLVATESSDEVKPRSPSPLEPGIPKLHDPVAQQGSSVSQPVLQLSLESALPSVPVPAEPESELKTVGRNPPSTHSDSADESSWSRSPTPIRSPLRLITEPPVPCAPSSRKTSPISHKKQHHFCSSPKASLRSSPLPKRRVPSPVKFQSQLTSGTLHGNDSRSPYQNRRSPVSQWSKTSPKTRVRSRSKSPYQMARLQSPDKFQMRSYAKAPGRSRSRTPANRGQSRSPIKSRISSKEPYRSRSRSPYGRILPGNPSRSSPYVPYRSRSRSPNCKALSGSPSTRHWTRLSPKARDSRSRSPAWRTRARSPRRRQSRSPETCGKLRSAGAPLRSSTLSSTSPEKLYSVQQLRLQYEGRSRSPASYSLKEGRETSDSYDMLKSPDRIRSPRPKRLCSSRSRSKSVEKGRNSQEKLPNDAKHEQNRSKMIPPCRRYERSRSKEGSPRSSSVGRKCSPPRADARMSPVRLRSRSNERLQPSKDSTSRISKSPVQRRSAAGVKASSYQRPPFRTGSKHIREDCKRSDGVLLSRSPVRMIQPAASHSQSAEKMNKFSDNISKMPFVDNSSRQHRSKSSERRTFSPFRSRNENSCFDDSVMKRKQYSDERDTKNGSQHSPLAVLTSEMRSGDKDSFKEIAAVKKSPPGSSADRYRKNRDDTVEEHEESTETARFKRSGKQKGVSSPRDCGLSDNSHTMSKRKAKADSIDPKTGACGQSEKKSYSEKPDGLYGSRRENAKLGNERKHKRNIGVSDCQQVLCAEDVLSTADKKFEDVGDLGVLDFKLEPFEKRSASSLCDESDDDEPENKLPMRKRIAERQDLLPADADSRQSEQKRRERRRKRERYVVENVKPKSASLSPNSSPDGDDRNSAAVKSVSSIVKVAGVNQRRAEVFTDPQAAAKRGTRVIQHTTESLSPFVDVSLRLSGDSAIGEQRSVSQGTIPDALESHLPVRKNALNTGLSC